MRKINTFVWRGIFNSPMVPDNIKWVAPAKRYIYESVTSYTLKRLPAVLLFFWSLSPITAEDGAYLEVQYSSRTTVFNNTAFGAGYRPGVIVASPAATPSGLQWSELGSTDRHNLHSIGLAMTLSFEDPDYTNYDSLQGVVGHFNFDFMFNRSSGYFHTRGHGDFAYYFSLPQYALTLAPAIGLNMGHMGISGTGFDGIGNNSSNGDTRNLYLSSNPRTGQTNFSASPLIFTGMIYGLKTSFRGFDLLIIDFNIFFTLYEIGIDDLKELNTGKFGSPSVAEGIVFLPVTPYLMDVKFTFRLGLVQSGLPHVFVGFRRANYVSLGAEERGWYYGVQYHI